MKQDVALAVGGKLGELALHQIDERGESLERRIAGALGGERHDPDLNGEAAIAAAGGRFED